MKAGFTTLAKILSVCLFLGLLSGYVWWRYDLAKQEEAKRIALQKALEEKAAKEEIVIDGIDLDEVIMSSSKSGIVVMPGSKRAPVFMPSSKIGTIPPEVMEDILKQAEGEGTDTTEEKERIILPGSKSGGLSLDELPQLKEAFKDEAQKPQKK